MCNPSIAFMEETATDLSLGGCIQELFPELEVKGDGVPEAIMLLREYRCALTTLESIEALKNKE